MRWRQIRGALPRRLRPVSVYATVATLTVAMFIALHHIGNQLPFELAVERLTEEFRATPGLDWGMRGGLEHDHTHYCEYSGTVLGGAMAAERGIGSALRDAVLLRIAVRQAGPGYCDELKTNLLAGTGLEADNRSWANVRHWFGGKAIYAIALRYFTVREFHIAIKAALYGCFLFLTLALLCVGWRALLVGVPVLASGVLYSGVERHFTVADGLPFAWALIAPALGTLVLVRGWPVATVRVCFFFAGMVSHFLWLFDGGNFVAATLIGLVVWLSGEELPSRQRLWRAASCVGAYTAGFAVSLAARVVIASSVAEGVAAQWFTPYLGKFAYRLSSPMVLDLRARDFDTFQVWARIDKPMSEWLLLTAVSAVIVAVLIAGCCALRRRPSLLLEVLWLTALQIPWCVHFLLPTDAPPRTARMMFLPLALCWCSLLAVLTRLEFRRAAIYSGGFSAAVGLLYGGTHLAGQWKAEAKLQNARLLAAARGDDAFALYLFELPEGRRANGTDPGQVAGRKLIYWKSRCAGKDLETAEGLEKRFYLHLMADEATLPERGRELGFVNADFSFYTRGQKFLGTCHAFVRLPNYAQRIRTGQVFYDGRFTKLWGREIDLTSTLDVWALVPDGPPVTRAFFDLYLNREHGMLVYSRTPCHEADTAARFFLHVEPLSHETLPRRRQQYGFDNLDFDFADRGRMMPVGSGRCVAAVKLPGYPLARLHTGQFAEDQLWEARMDFVSASAPER